MPFTDDRALEARLRTLPRDRPAAVVFSGHITGLAVARSLGRRGVAVVVLDRDERGIALSSRHAHATAAVPNPQTQEGDFVERLLQIGEWLPQQAVLFPTNDDWLLATLRARAKLETHYRFPVASLDIVDRILNKVELYREAKRLGIPIPNTHELSDATWETVRDEAQYPLILKPAHQRVFYDAFGVKVFQVDTPAAFEAFWRRTRPHDLVAQEIIPAEHAEFVSLGSHIDARGEMRGAFVGRKLEQYPEGFGTACLVEGIDDPEVIQQGTRLLRALRYHGISELEYIRDRRDGVLKVIDVNTRVWKWIGLPIAAGIDLPWLAYAEATGLDERAHAPKLPLRWSHAFDYARLQATRGAACALATGRESPVVDAVLDLDDPAPGVALASGLLEEGNYYCPC